MDKASQSSIYYRAYHTITVFGGLLGNIVRGLAVCNSSERRFLQDLTNRARDSLVSFGERLSTRLFASFLRRQVSFRDHALWCYCS